MDDRLSIAQIARQIQCSRSTISAALKTFGFRIRRSDLIQKSKSQLRYGESWYRNKVVPNKREFAAIEEMRTWRQEGLSYWKIADLLNDLGVPTKSKNKRWSAKTVHQILKRAIS